MGAFTTTSGEAATGLPLLDSTPLAAKFPTGLEAYKLIRDTFISGCWN